MKKVPDEDLAHFRATFALEEALTEQRREVAQTSAKLHDHLVRAEAAAKSGNATIEVSEYVALLISAVTLANELDASLDRESRLAVGGALRRLDDLPNRPGRPADGPITRLGKGTLRVGERGRPKSYSADWEQSELQYFLSRKVEFEAKAGRKLTDLWVAEQIIEKDEVARQMEPTAIKRKKFAKAYAKVISRWRNKYGYPARPAKLQNL